MIVMEGPPPAGLSGGSERLKASKKQQTAPDPGWLARLVNQIAQRGTAEEPKRDSDVIFSHDRREHGFNPQFHSTPMGSQRFLKTHPGSRRPTPAYEVCLNFRKMPRQRGLYDSEFHPSMNIAPSESVGIM